MQDNICFASSLQQISCGAMIQLTRRNSFHNLFCFVRFDLFDLNNSVLCWGIVRATEEAKIVVEFLTESKRTFRGTSNCAKMGGKRAVLVRCGVCGMERGVCVSVPCLGF